MYIIQLQISISDAMADVVQKQKYSPLTKNFFGKKLISQSSQFTPSFICEHIWLRVNQKCMHIDRTVQQGIQTYAVQLTSNWNIRNYTLFLAVTPILFDLHGY